MVGELEDTLFADGFNRAFIMETISDAQSHIRSCQWLDVS